MGRIFIDTGSFPLLKRFIPFQLFPERFYFPPGQGAEKIVVDDKAYAGQAPGQGVAEGCANDVVEMGQGKHDPEHAYTADPHTCLLYTSRCV